MGISGIWKEIGPGERIALSKLAVEKFEQTGRPLRIAVDISIWLFQIRSGKEGSNPALRTFYYRLLRLISLCIHPLFVFDGPNKPPFKRNKRTGQNVASIPEFLAKQLLKQFGLPFHIAPGEAEAECALLQKEGLVDAVLTEDVDSLMFGSGVTIRNWSAEGRTNKTPTHVNVHDAQKIKSGPSRLDREGMVLVALMSGGDYIPEGIPGCGPKLACEAARAGFGAELCRISRSDKAALREWREKLEHELHTNESKLFKRKHSTLVVPEDFPNRQVLGYYTQPAVSPPEKVERLRQTLQWDQELDLPELRTFTAEAFDWSKLGGAKKFIRNLAPALLVREMRLRAERGADADDLEMVQQKESELVKSIHGRRNHAITDNTPELRIAFLPLDLVPIDLDAEEPDDELPSNESDIEEDALAPADDQDAPDGPATSTQRRGPSTYDPSKLEKTWILETFVKVGTPLKVQDWEASIREPRKRMTAQPATKRTAKTSRSKATTDKGGMPSGALNRFTRVTKPGVSLSQGSSKEKTPDVGHVQSSQGLLSPPSSQPEITREPEPCLRMPSALSEPQRPKSQATVIEICSSPEPEPPQRGANVVATIELWPADDLPPSVTKRRRRSPLRRTQTLLANLDGPPDGRPRPFTPPPPDILTAMDIASSPSLPSLSHLIPLPLKRTKTALHPAVPARPKTPPVLDHTSEDQQLISLLSTPASHHSRPPATISEWLRRSQSVTPSGTRHINLSTHNIQPVIVPSANQPRRAPLASLTEELDLTSSLLLQPFHPGPNTQPRSCNQASPQSVQITGVDDLPEQESRTSNTISDPYSRPNPGPSLRRSPRHTVSPQPPRPPQQQQQKAKRRIQLRESLDGAWKLSDVDALDLSGPDASASASSAARMYSKGQDLPSRAAEGGSHVKAAGRRRGWRASEVEILDLTAD